MRMSSLCLLEVEELVWVCYLFVLRPHNRIIYEMFPMFYTFISVLWMSLWCSTCFNYCISISLHRWGGRFFIILYMKPFAFTVKIYTRSSLKHRFHRNHSFWICLYHPVGPAHFFARWQGFDGALILFDGRTWSSVLKACICVISQNPLTQIQSACTSGYNHILNIGYAIICL